MRATQIEVKELPADRHPDVLRMRVDAFTAAGEVEWPEEGQPYYIPAGRRIGAFDGDRLVGHAGAWDFGQWFGGRRIPMGGVGGVIVLPEARGRGVTHALMPEMLQRQADWGDMISCLYPTAPDLYRRFGYAFAGTRLQRSVRTAVLAGLPRPQDPPELAVFDFDADLDGVVALLDAAAARGHGRVDRGRTRHQNLAEPDEEIRAWVASRDGDIVGYVQIERQEPGSGDRSMRRQHVGDLVVGDPDTYLALWRLLGSDATVCRTTSFVSAPHEPLLDLVSLPPAEVEVREDLWMARLIDVKGAMEGRGWPAVDVTVAVEVRDPILRHNAGTFHLLLSRGQAEWAPARRAQNTVSLDISALSTLYTGHVSAVALRHAGRLHGGTPEDLAALDMAFSSPQPWMHDFF